VFAAEETRLQRGEPGLLYRYANNYVDSYAISIVGRYVEVTGAGLPSSQWLPDQMFPAPCGFHCVR
jgi:hypothetical protein